MGGEIIHLFCVNANSISRCPHSVWDEPPKNCYEPCRFQRIRLWNLKNLARIRIFDFAAGRVAAHVHILSRIKRAVDISRLAFDRFRCRIIRFRCSWSRCRLRLHLGRRRLCFRRGDLGLLRMRSRSRPRIYCGRRRVSCRRGCYGCRRRGSSRRVVGRGCHLIGGPASGQHHQTCPEDRRHDPHFPLIPALSCSRNSGLTRVRRAQSYPIA